MAEGADPVAVEGGGVDGDAEFEGAEGAVDDEFFRSSSSESESRTTRRLRQRGRWGAGGDESRKGD